MSVTPQFIGQRYKDTNTGNIWIANSTTPGDWTLEVQNIGIEWLPTSQDYGEMLGLLTNKSSTLSITSLTIRAATFPNALYFQSNQPSLRNISLPNAVSSTGFFYIYASSLTSFSAPLLQSLIGPLAVMSFNLPSAFALVLPSLQTVAGDFLLIDCGSISLPSLVSVTGKIDWSYTSLTTVSFPMFLPTNGRTIEINDCNLDAASVNHVLARCVANAGFVSGQVNLSGGTNAAPTGQGITDKNTLNARQPALAITN